MPNTQKKEEEFEATIRFRSMQLSIKRLTFVSFAFFPSIQHNLRFNSLISEVVFPISRMDREIKMRSPCDSGSAECPLRPFLR